MTDKQRTLLDFELHVMDLCGECKTADDYRKMSETLHEAVETAIQDLCWDNHIEDYEPPY